MEYFYDGQIRRYVGQIIRMLSGFKYQSNDGKQTVVPVMYGDMSRQVAHIIKDNSENKIQSAPRIAVYISNLQMDRTRLSDATYVSKVHIRERKYDEDQQQYTPIQGNGYTVERIMPTPYKLTVKADIWATNTDQKLQIMEQIMMLFNPSLEIQTTDNFVDWTSLSVVELTDITFSSRAIPQGLETEIDIGTLTFDTPIWVSPPSKVKRLGVIHDIVMSIHDDSYTFNVNEYVSVSGFDIFVYYDKSSGYYYAELLDPKAAILALRDDGEEVWEKFGGSLSWRVLLDQLSRDTIQFTADRSQIFLKQTNGNEIVGTLAINELDETKLVIKFDADTYNTNTVIVGPVATKGTVDAIINPETYNPGTVIPGTRFLLLNDIAEGTQAWNGFFAAANSIIEFNGSSWQELTLPAEPIYTTNIRTGVQYKLEDGEWVRAFEGEYRKGDWRIVL